MTGFAIARYGSNDWRLIKWDGSATTEIGSGWSEQRDMRQCAEALMEYHGTGNQPFSSREGTIDSLALANQWPLPTRDMTLNGETMPWHDPDPEQS